MRTSFLVSILILLISPYCFAQEPVTTLDFSWQRARHAPIPGDEIVVPMSAVTKDSKYFERKAREQLTKNNAPDPNEASIDGRSATFEKMSQESRTPKVEDVKGYAYRVNFKNTSEKAVSVFFWEYRFAELANPANVVRRQFLCSVNLKPGDKQGVSVFSMRGPSDVITAEDLAKVTEKLFDEKVFVNRVEYADGTLRQRGNWKYDDYQKAIEHATSVPWGKEVCRGF